ncbi:MAG: class I SAM-dependent methyltransferase [Promethearchaeota archaeon]
MNPEQLKEMQEIQWWHKMELDGVMTPGRDFTQEKLITIKLPQDLKGKKVIDVGAWDGFFSFECERRGADVLAIDTIMWKEGPTFNSQKNKETIHSGKKGFDFAHKILNSKVQSKEIEVMDLANILELQQFDLVLCLGILYHMKDPLGMCKVMYNLCEENGMLILETHTDMFSIDKPVMAFYPENECNNDPGTWFGPNPQCIEAMLKVVGFKDIRNVYQNDKTHRVVFHARKN